MAILDAKTRRRIDLAIHKINTRIAPFFGGECGHGLGVEAIIAVDDESVTVAADEFWRLYINPEKIKSYSDADLTGLILKEISHLSMRHFARFQEIKDSVRCPAGDLPDEIKGRIWTLAASAAINEAWDECIEARGLQNIVQIPEDEARPKDLGQPPMLGAEERYILLMKSIKEIRRVDPEYLPPHAKFVRSGSCADGMRRPWELDYDDEANPGISEMSRKIREENIKQSMSEAIQAIKEKEEEESGRGKQEKGCRGERYGNIPALIAMDICKSDTKTTRVPWQKLLRDIIDKEISRRIGYDDYSYAVRTARQCRYPDIRLPGYIRQYCRIGIVLDCSGSMCDGKAIPQGLAEIDNIIASINTEADIFAVCVDTEAGKVQKVKKAKDVEVVGGGGTDMRVGIKLLDEKYKPHVIITITDGQSPWEMPKPKSKHITILVGAYDKSTACGAEKLGPVFLGSNQY